MTDEPTAPPVRTIPPTTVEEFCEEYMKGLRPTPMQAMVILSVIGPTNLLVSQLPARSGKTTLYLAVSSYFKDVADGKFDRG